MLIEILFGILTIVFVAYKYLTWNFDYWIKRNVDGPKPIPIFGNFYGSTMQSKHSAIEIDEIYKEYKSTGNFIGVFSQRSPSIIALSPELIKEMLVKNFKNFHDNDLADMVDNHREPIISRSPFMLGGDEWKERRGEITPAFTAVKIRAMYPIIHEICKKMTIYINGEIKKQSVLDVHDLAARYATDVVSNCIYGHDAKSFQDSELIVRKMGQDLFNPDTGPFIWWFLSFYLPFLRKIYSVNFVPERVVRFLTELMHNAITLRENGTIVRDDFLSYLMQLRKKNNLTDTEMTAYTVFFLDGIETASVLISFMLYELANNQDVQQKLRNEIMDMIQKNTVSGNDSSSGGDVILSYEEITEMPYLDQVFNETIRLNPPATSLFRKCTEKIAVNLKDGKSCLIEKDISITIPTYSIHRDPDYYKNPDIFDPERFAPEMGGLKKYKDQGVFLSFGDGPRICLGIRFATVKCKAAIVEIIRNFTITVNQQKTQIPFKIDPKVFLLLPVGGIHLDFKSLN